MLEGLYEIDWSRLHHAYGAADDVPKCIEGLASSDPKVRADADGTLYGNIWHQGTIYEATSYAVPFLLELVRNPGSAYRPGLLMYLATLRTGTSRNPEWVKTTTLEIEKGLPLFRDLISDEHSETRSFAAYAVACCEDWESRDLLLDQLKCELDASTKASILLSLGDLAAIQAVKEVTESLTDTDFGVQVAAAVTIAKLCGPDSPKEAVNVLADAVIEYKRIEPYEHLPQSAAKSLPVIVADAIPLLGAPFAPYITEVVLESLRAMQSYEVDEPLDALLGISFGQSSQTLSSKDLSLQQRSILLALADTDSLWHELASQARAYQFAQYGLPGSREALRDLATS